MRPFELASNRSVGLEGQTEKASATTPVRLAIGNVWASRNGGKCLFVMPTADDYSVIDAATRE